MTDMEIYRLRAKLTRWIKARDAYQKELDEKLEQVAKVGYYRGPGSVDYPRSKVKEYSEKIASVQGMDLRTSEEKRGYQRKEYERKKPIEFRGMTDKQVERIEKEYARMARSSQRRQAAHKRAMETPGSPERQESYEWSRQHILDMLAYYGHAPLAAYVAIAEKQGRDPKLDKSRQRDLDECNKLLAELADLDAKFSDCEQGTLWSAIERDRERSEVDDAAERRRNRRN